MNNDKKLSLSNDLSFAHMGKHTFKSVQRATLGIYKSFAGSPRQGSRPEAVGSLIRTTQVNTWKKRHRQRIRNKIAAASRRANRA